jgi:hypothetical protein
MYNGYGMNYNPYQSGAMNDVLSQYKVPYQPMQVQPQMPQTPKSPASDINWVQGEAGAKAYLVAPNTTVTLWDSERSTIYVKSADQSGIPSMKILDFVVRADSTQGNTPILKDSPNPREFVGYDAFNELKAKYEELEGVVKSLVKKEEEESNV